MTFILQWYRHDMTLSYCSGTDVTLTLKSYFNDSHYYGTDMTRITMDGTNMTHILITVVLI